MTVKEQLIALDKKKYELLNESEGNLKHYDCPICKNRGVVYSWVNDEIRYKDCKCMPIRKAHETLETCGLKDDFERYTFEAFKIDNPFQKFMKEMALDFLQNETRAIIFSGMTGSGKTHLCTAISKKLILKYGDFEYMRYAEDFIKIRKDLDNFYVDIKERAEDKMRRYRTVKVLYIDDFLKVGNDDKIFDLIDARYKDHNLITIISTERTSNDIKSIDMAVHGRLKEMSGKHWINIGYDEKKNFRV